MLISRRHKFIFFHTPKVAGSSITSALRGYSDYPIERVYNYMIDYLGEQPWLNLYPMHISPAQLRMKMKSESNFDCYYKFAFVRNTWDWHVSQYCFHKQNSFTSYHHIFKDISFEEYVDWAVQPENIESARSCQKQFLSDKSGQVIVNYVGQMESIEKDFNNICEHLGIRLKLPRRNSSNRQKKYQSYYSETAYNKILKAFEEDIRFFKFSF